MRVLVVALALGVVTPGFARERPLATLYAFFATWCAPCRVEIPHLEALHRRYAGDGLEVVLVSEDGPSTAAEIPAFLDRFGVTAPWRLDVDSELLVRHHPAATLPFTVLLDREGRTVYAHAGYEPGDEVGLEAAVVDALAAPVAADAGWRGTGSIQGQGVWRRSSFLPRGDPVLTAGAGRIEVGAHRGAVPCAEGEACLEVHTRVDGAVIGGPEIAGVGEVRLERVQARLWAQGVDARLGDTYAQLGHGVALSLRRVDPLGRARALGGGRVEIPVLGTRLRLLGGAVNPQNLDPIAYRLLDERPDRLAAAELEVPLSEGRMEVYVLRLAQPAAAPDGTDVTVSLAGASGQGTLGPLTLGAEVVAGRRAASGAVSVPYAGYLRAAFLRGETHLLLEGKLYRGWELGRSEQSLLYHEPPTLERDDQEVPGNRDAAGARVRVEQGATPQLTLYGNALVYAFTLDRTPVFRDPALAAHAYGGADWRPSGRLSVELSGGYRRELAADGDLRLWMWHAGADASWSPRPGLSLTVEWRHRSETKVLFGGPRPFVRGLAVAGAGVPGLGTVSVLYGYSTEAASRPTSYPALALSAVLPRGGEVRLLLGRLAGGRVCVSGSCRDVPPFEGARLDLVVRF